MFEHTSNSFILAAAAAVALIVWLDSRTGSGAGKRWSFAGRGDQPGADGGSSQSSPAYPGDTARSIEPRPRMRTASGSEQVAANTQAEQPAGNETYPQG